MLAEIFSFNLFHFFLIFSRIGAALMFMPGFSAGFVSMRIRLLLALMLSLILVPIVSQYFPPVPLHPLDMLTMVAGEVLVGVFFGLVMAIMLSAMHTLGTLVAFTAALSNAFTFDAVSQAQGSILAGFYTNLAMVLLFVTDLHHLMLQAIFDSYTLFTPGQLPPMGDFAQFVARTVAETFKIGLQLATPFIVFSYGFQVCMGLISRLNPQFQIYFVAMPAQIIFSVVLLALTLSGIMLVFLNYYQQGLIGFLQP